MKARDIIPGWPRGRSTSQGWQDDTIGVLRLYWTLRGIGAAYDRAMLEDDIDADRRYHKAQQRMADLWHKGWTRDSDGNLWPRAKDEAPK